MRRIRMPSWQVLVSGGLVSLFILLAFLSGGGKAIATSFAVLLSGRSTQGTRLENIQVQSWTHGVMTTREAGSGIATGRRQYQPLLIRKRIDKSSPLLMKALGQNETFPTLTLTVDQGGPRSDNLTITLRDARVTEITTGDVDGDGFPDESVAFAYQGIAWSADGREYEDVVTPNAPPTFAMAINEKGVPNRPKKQSTVAAYRTQIISPRDAASGLPTGKRQHKPLLLAVPGSDDTHELTEAFLTGRHLERVSLITYGADGQPTGAVSLVNVTVVSMTETRRVHGDPHVDEIWGDPHVDESVFGFEPQPIQASYELVYQRIEWLDAAGNVTHEDTWDQQR